MKSLLTLGLISFAFTFCGLQERLKGLTSSTPSNANVATTGSNSTTNPAGPTAEKAKPSAQQQAIIDGASETKWDDQGLSWKLPAG